MVRTCQASPAEPAVLHTPCQEGARQLPHLMQEDVAGLHLLVVVENGVAAQLGAAAVRQRAGGVAVAPRGGRVRELDVDHVVIGEAVPSGSGAAREDGRPAGHGSRRAAAAGQKGGARRPRPPGLLA